QQLSHFTPVCYNTNPNYVGQHLQPAVDVEHRRRLQDQTAEAFAQEGDDRPYFRRIACQLNSSLIIPGSSGRIEVGQVTRKTRLVQKSVGILFMVAII